MMIVMNESNYYKCSPMLVKVKQAVTKLLANETSGHGMEHINRVVSLSQEFATAEKANLELVTLIVLLHDVDDRKLFKNDNRESLPHARKIMNDANTDKVLQEKTLEELNRIGYHKRLDGVIPNTIEGKSSPMPTCVIVWEPVGSYELNPTA